MTTATLATATRPAPTASAPALPPGLLTALLLFWGGHTGTLWGAVPLALLLAWLPHSPTRFPLSDREFHRLADLSALLWLGAIVYLLLNPGSGGLQTLLVWSPLLMAPLLLVQCYSLAGTLPLSSLFWSVRYAEKRGAFVGKRVDLRPSVAALCLLAASPIQHEAAQWSYPLAVAVALSWLLIYYRPPRYPLGGVALLLLLVAALAWGVQAGLRHGQEQVENWLMTWIDDWLADWPLGQTSRLGDVRAMKGRDEIVLRLQADSADAKSPPGGGLLPTATFDRYTRGEWWVTPQYTRLDAADDRLLRWVLHPSATAPTPERPTATLSMNLRRGRGVLPRPVATVALDDLPVGVLERHDLGTLRVADGPGLVRYRVELDARFPLAPPPTEDDLRVPPTELAWIAPWLATQPLDNATPSQRLAAVEQQFADYRYTLNPPHSLAQFFEEQRAGHCEYFATATVLLLRAVGIPARYVTGYAVSDFSRLEGAWIARRRHGHAWAMAHVDGQWRVVDTTPSQWLAEEELAAGWWQGLGDVWGFLWYQVDRWRWRVETDTVDQSVGWLVVAGGLVGLLIWRVRRRRQVRIAVPTPRRGPALAQGADSPFFATLAQLERRHGPRPRGLAVGRWLTQLGLEPELRVAYDDHCRRRFRPRDDDAVERS